MQCDDGVESERGIDVGGGGCEREVVFVLKAARGGEGGLKPG